MCGVAKCNETSKLQELLGTMCTYEPFLASHAKHFDFLYCDYNESDESIQKASVVDARILISAFNVIPS